jgi:ABC-2 type transport system ATP-binding protein
MSPKLASPILSVRGLGKTYKGGLSALTDINLDIRKGEIFALLGPNGAGKSTLINAICGIVTPSTGAVTVAGADIGSGYRTTRSLIGLVPQELSIDMFETVWDVVSFSRGLFGLPPNPAFIEQVLKDLSLLDKRKAKLMALSGGMKRRVLIAKALAHEPEVLFLDEPTAGVDVELRRDMWALVRRMRERGVTIILTTHYIEEAEEMADRVGVILKGQLILVEEKTELMKKLGRKRLTLHLQDRMDQIPDALAEWGLKLGADGRELDYEFDIHAEDNAVPALIRRLGDLGVHFKDLNTTTSSLEDIFVKLVQDKA